MQDCEDQAEFYFSNYEIDFSSVSDLITYLDYFGDIEKAYDCSGIWNYYAAYYFSDIDRGIPKEACANSIKNKMIKREIIGMGIAYFITGIIAGVVMLIQYGLCCRKPEQKQEKREDNYKR